MTTIAFKEVRKVDAMEYRGELCADGWDWLAEHDAESVDAEEIAGKLFITRGGSFYAERVGGGFFFWERV